jgi:organic radical activating enzyme
MFGKNEIVGQKYFNEAGDKLYVTSIFFTLQGEGPFRGYPAVFVRFAKCNLACSFCDTYFDGGDWLTVDEIEQRIDKVITDHFKGNVPLQYQYDEDEYHINQRNAVLVVTGGEPMLQKNIVPFLDRMNRIFKHTQIESNGTIYQDIPEDTILVVSPKCSEKNGKPIRYLQPHPKVLEKASCLKFVMNNDPESPYSSVPDWALDHARDYGTVIFCSPMNIYNKEPEKAKQLRSQKNDVTLEERSNVDEVISFWEDGLLNMNANQHNHEYTARYCVDNGCILNLQMHLYAGLA